MLSRQKVILALLKRFGKPLSPTVFVKYSFLLRKETDLTNLNSFYDFVPYKYGPFSFSLYRERTILRLDNYITEDSKSIGINNKNCTSFTDHIYFLPEFAKESIEYVFKHYRMKSQNELVDYVYSKYPWYASKNESKNLLSDSLARINKAPLAVYTAGYEGKSVDFFYNKLLYNGIEMIIDVRANPMSRKYGFAKSELKRIANKLDIRYRHFPNMGIPSKYRVKLSDYESYQTLLAKYDKEILKFQKNGIIEIGKLMKASPSVLVCFEKDFQFCHRSRLASAVANVTGLEINHI